MFKYFICPLVVLFSLFSACHKKTIIKSNDTALTKTEAADDYKGSETKKIIVDKTLDVQKLGGSATRIDSLEINGDILSIFVNYGGGCKEHIFELYSDGTYAKSLPPIATLYLKHINNNDGCRRLVIRELKFDISAIKFKGTLNIKVADQSIQYRSK
jgi:hypothetical protein